MNTNPNYHVTDRALKFDVSRDLRRGGESFDLFLFTRTRLSDGNIRAGRATEVIFKANEQRDFGVEFGPLLSLKRDEAQHLMDALWDAGLKPTQGSGSPGQVQAMEAHLSDLRKLVFDPGISFSSEGRPVPLPPAPASPRSVERPPSLWKRITASLRHFGP